MSAYADRSGASYVQTAYTPPPVVSSISPAAGRTAGGSSVTISGTGFTGATAVAFGSQAATSFAVNSGSTITAIAPAASASTVDVTVTTAGGTSATSTADQFTYSGPPTMTTQVASPNATAGSSTSFTPVTATGGVGTLGYSISPSLPAGLSIDASTGLISGTPTALLPTTTFTVTATDSAAQTSTATFSLTVNAPTLTASQSVSSTAATQNAPITSFRPVTGSGGFGTLTYSVSPSLPAGLSLDPTTGQISGTPTTLLAATTFTVQVTDQATPTAQTASQTFSLSVSAPPALTAAQNAAATTLVANSPITPVTPITASGGYGTLTYSVSPSLPAGLAFSASTGQITGTPTALLQAATFTVTVGDGASQTISQTFSLTVNAPTLSPTQAVPTTLATANASLTAFRPVTATGGFGTLTYSVSPALPAGLTFSATNGQITGTPTVLLQATTFTVTVTDQTTPSIQSSSQSFSLTVNAATLVTTQTVPTTVLTANTPAAAFAPVTASGGFGTRTYSVSPSLPAGLTLSPTSGQISGTPTALLQATTFTVTVTDQTTPSMQTSQKTFSLTVNPVVLTTAQAVPSSSVTANAPLTAFAPVTASGGFGTLTFAVSPALPAGLAFSATNGQISGTPTALLQPATFTVTVTDQTTPSIQTSQKTFSLAVTPLGLTLTQPASSVSATAGVALTATAPVTATGGFGALTFSVSPSLPAGLQIDATSGQISGTATALLPTTTFTLTVTDKATPTAQVASKTFSLTVTPQTLTTTAAVPSSTVNASSPITPMIPVTATGGFGTLTYAITPSLPAGLSFSTTTGQITGTATVLLPATTFTVTVTDQTTPTIQMSSQTFSLTVAPPLLVTTLAVPTTEATANLPIPPFTPVTATGGFGTLTYAISPTLPAGLSFSTTTGQITGTPTALITATPFTVTVTDQTTPSPQTSSRIFSLAVTKVSTRLTLTESASSTYYGAPVTFTATVSGGRMPTGTVTFSDGGTVLATIALSGVSASLTTKTLATGAHTISAVYSGDPQNTSSSATVTLAVNARPNPAQNADVLGLMRAEVATAERFGQTQIDNVFHRLEELHDEDDDDADGGPVPSRRQATPGSDVTSPGAAASAPAPSRAAAAAPSTILPIRLADAPLFAASPSSSALAYAGENAMPLSAPVGATDGARAVQALAGGLPVAASALNRAGVLPFSLWVAGSLEFGKRADSGAVDRHFTTSGLTVGIDGRLVEGLKAGLAVGVGLDRTSVGSSGTQSHASGTSATAYLDYRFLPHSYLDVTAGYAGLRYRLARWSGDGNVMLDGRRDGGSVYGSVVLTQEFKWQNVKLSPYGRVDILRTMLAGYGETGSSIWALNYDALNATTFSEAIGARIAYKVPMSWGVLTPAVRFEYRRFVNGAYSQGLNYADLADMPGYVAQSSAGSSDMLRGGVSLRAEMSSATALEIEYMRSGGIDRQPLSQQGRASVKLSF